MVEVFVSYSHYDNLDNPAITHEVTQAADHLMAVYRHVCNLPADVEFNDFVFFDESSISSGESIPDSVQRAIEECSIMLALYSPKYFMSKHCFAEWREFKRIQALEQKEYQRATDAGVPARPPKKIIPVQVRAVPPNTLERIMDPDWLSELTEASGLKRSITSEILLDINTRRLDAELRRIDSTIQDHILARRWSSAELRSASNILAIRSKVEKDSLKTPEIEEELAKGAGRLKYNRQSPVCVLYAGGTVGMVQRDDSDEIHADFEMAKDVDALVRHLRSRISALPVDMHFFSLKMPIDSSNVTAGDWANLANIVLEQMNEYQGFVILHGTNTLAYSASALSFLLGENVTKPVIFTGSEVPISVHNTDATHNVENAIRAAAWQSYNGPMLVPEVCVYWNNHLYRGNRVTKKFASDRSGSYHTPNMPIPLATLSNEKLEVEHSQIIRRETSSATTPSTQGIVDLSEANVGVMFIHPDMDFLELESSYPNTLDGLLLLSYGNGNVPEDPRFISAIKRLIDHGTVVCNVTQCPYGRVELKLFETSATLFDLGVIDAYDMTLEAAYTKLVWAIGRWGSGRQAGIQESIRRTFQRNLAGEMGASIYDINFRSSETFFNVRGTGYMASDVVRFDRNVHRYDIAEVFFRLEGVRFPEGVDSGTVRVLFGRPSDRTAGGLEDNLLAEFTKTLTAEEKQDGVFDKNLEVTHPFRKLFNNEEFQVSVAVSGSGTIAFTSMRLYLYAKPVR